METPVKVGDVVAEKYSVERIVAAGGNGIVVEARHRVLLERCAIKFLLPGALEQPMARERFVREAQALARLKSDHIVRIFDVGELPDGTPYMVMEYLEGADLETLVRRRGALPADEAALYVLQVCAALADAHALGIVHRDLKPANVVVTQTADGTPRVKLIDFGVSKVMRDARGLSPLKTGDGTLIGTPLFMAPEQVYGGEVGTASDVWAVGVLLYHLMTGALPFQEEATVMSLAHILGRPPKPIGSHGVAVPPDMEQLVLACLEKNAAARPESVAEIADRLAPFAAEGQPISRHVRRVLDSIPEARPSLVGAPPVSKMAVTLAAPTRDSTMPASTTTSEAPARPRWVPWAAIGAAFALSVTVALLVMRGPPARPVAASDAVSVTPAATLPPPAVTAGGPVASPIGTATPGATTSASASVIASAPPPPSPRAAPRARATAPAPKPTAPAPPPAASSSTPGQPNGFDLGDRH